VYVCGATVCGGGAGRGWRRGERGGRRVHLMKLKREASRVLLMYSTFTFLYIYRERERERGVVVVHHMYIYIYICVCVCVCVCIISVHLMKLKREASRVLLQPFHLPTSS
jgi:hypothetical protein